MKRRTVKKVTKRSRSGRSYRASTLGVATRKVAASERRAKRQEYMADVKRPGKFEGEAPYVPYFWEVGMDGMADDDDGEILKFVVTEEDRQMFPELRGRKRVRLRETDQGFVVEV